MLLYKEQQQHLLRGETAVQYLQQPNLCCCSCGVGHMAEHWRPTPGRQGNLCQLLRLSEADLGAFPLMKGVKTLHTALPGNCQLAGRVSPMMEVKEHFAQG